MKFVCPELNKWYSIYKDLRNAWENSGGKCPPPPMALILASWSGTNDCEKAWQWKETIEWAGRFGFSHLIPELPPEESYLVSEMSSYYLGPTGKPMKLDWNYDAKEVPSAEDVDRAVRILRENWNNIAGPNLSNLTSVQGFSGRKRRRIIREADFGISPPWGTWDSLAQDESRRREFTLFRQSINKAIAPLEIDHIDFVPRIQIDKDESRRKKSESKLAAISREKAANIASQYLQENGRGFTVNDVYSWDEIPFRKPCLYYVEPFDITQCWIVYLNGPDTGLMLKSSDIVIVSRDSGKVFYFGTANDEG
jgi:hypothetical protein